MVPWSPDTRYSEKLSSDSKFWYVDPLQKQGHICFGTRSLAEARSWPFFIFRLPAEAKLQLFKFVDMLTSCRSKVTFVFGSWSPAEARSWPFFIFRLPVEAKLQLFKFVDMLTPCRSKVTFVFGAWSPAEARSWPFFIFRLHAEAKS